MQNYKIMCLFHQLMQRYNFNYCDNNHKEIAREQAIKMYNENVLNR